MKGHSKERINPGFVEAGPRERIVAAALELFYRRGYSSTSVDQIIERAGAYKKSFYRYFPTRDDLGREYLDRQGTFFLKFFKGMLERYDEFEDFLRAWMRILRREVRSGVFLGCPFAFFAADLKGLVPGPDREKFNQALARVVELRRRQLSIYLRRCKVDGRTLPAGYPVRELADRVILVYQGGIGLYAISGDDAYIRRLEKEISFVVRASVAGSQNGLEI
ncbi:MAG: TetR/AcrR family transcriptional regulator [Leptospirales bacterium]|jgi:TetR/AcrR family transcriptional repressor of nem operon